MNYMTRPSKRKPFKKIFLLAAIPLIALAAGIIVYFFWYKIPVLNDGAICINCGEPVPEPSLWFARLKDDAVFQDLNVDTQVPGEYQLSVLAGKREYPVALQVLDVEPPKAEPVNIVIPKGSAVTPENFYRNVVDHSEVTAAFTGKSAPNTAAEGDYDVSVTLTDKYGNQAEVKAKCEVFGLKEELRVELGEEKTPQVGDFVTSKHLKKFSLVKSEELNDDYYNNPGIYSVTIKADGKKYNSKVIVSKTVPPKAKAVDLLLFIGEKSPASDFYELEEADGESEEIKADFVEKPDWSLIGEQKVKIKVSDIYSNSVVVESVLTIVEDTVPPVINISGDIYVVLGDNISYRAYVSADDDYDPAPALSVDSTQVNVNEEGSYPVTYTATDRGGNSVSEMLYVHVVWPSDELLYQMADDILNRLGVYGMEDPVSRVYAIHGWVIRNVKYTSVNTQVPNNLIVYRGMATLTGECTTMQRISQLLLSRAGVENQIIDNTGGTHSWNLIKIGEWWYHYDSTPFRDGHNRDYSYMFSESEAQRITSVRLQLRDCYVYDYSYYTGLAP